MLQILAHTHALQIHKYILYMFYPRTFTITMNNIMSLNVAANKLWHTHDWRCCHADVDHMLKETGNIWCPQAVTRIWRKMISYWDLIRVCAFLFFIDPY